MDIIIAYQDQINNNDDIAQIKKWFIFNINWNVNCIFVCNFLNYMYSLCRGIKYILYNIYKIIKYLLQNKDILLINLYNHILLYSYFTYHISLFEL